MTVGMVAKFQTDSIAYFLKKNIFTIFPVDALTCVNHKCMLICQCILI